MFCDSVEGSLGVGLPELGWALLGQLTELRKQGRERGDDSPGRYLGPFAL